MPLFFTSHPFNVSPLPYFPNTMPLYFGSHGIEQIRACIQKIRQGSKVKLWLLCTLPVQDMPIMKHFWMPVGEGFNRLGQTLKAGNPYQPVTLGAKIVMKPFDDPLLLLVNKHEFISHVYQLCSSTMFISFVQRPIYQQKPNLIHLKMHTELGHLAVQIVINYLSTLCSR